MKIVLSISLLAAFITLGTVAIQTNNFAWLGGFVIALFIGVVAAPSETK